MMRRRERGEGTFFLGGGLDMDRVGKEGFLIAIGLAYWYLYTSSYHWTLFLKCNR